MMLSVLLLGSTLTEARFRNIKKMLPSGTAKQFKDYGCHCWRKNDQGKRQVGFGADIPIVDPIDQACYDLSVCYETAHDDFAIDSNSKYKWNAEDGCTNSKNGEGKTAICACDVTFAQTIMGDSDRGSGSASGSGNARRRTGTRNFPEGSSLLSIVDINRWGNKKNLKKNNIDWDAKAKCVAPSTADPEPEDLFCGSQHVERCLNACGSCFIIRELDGCLEEPSGCGTCDGCTFSGWDKEICLDSERCFVESHCNNGRRDASEQGVDCGGKCPTSCAEAEDLTPFCELIKSDNACGESCTYAFSDPKFLQADPPIMPQSLVIDICTTPEGKYTSLCPKQCACENQRNAHACEATGVCSWEPDMEKPEHQRISFGTCTEVPSED